MTARSPQNWASRGRCSTTTNSSIRNSPGRWKAGGRPDPEEELKAKALAEYHALPGFRPDPDFSKRDKAKFDSLISITLGEVEKRKQQAAGTMPAAAPATAGEIPEGLPTMYALPQNFSKMSKEKSSPDDEQPESRHGKDRVVAGSDRSLKSIGGRFRASIKPI